MEHSDPKPFAAAISAALTAAAPSPEQSTKASTSSVELERRRHFLQVFRRWEALFKRADRGDEQAEKWFIAEYFKSLGHLSPAGLEALTDQLKKRCTFFPSIKECLEIVHVPQLSGQWGNPFVNRSPALYVETRAALAPPRPAGVLGKYGDRADG